MWLKYKHMPPRARLKAAKFYATVHNDAYCWQYAIRLILFRETMFFVIMMGKEHCFTGIKETFY